MKLKNVGLVGAMLLSGAALSMCTPKAADNGWQLVWEETFDSTDVNPEVWSRIDRGNVDWNNYMTKADTCYEMRDGNLVLKGIAAYEGDGDSVPYLTGGVYTKDKVAFGNGRMEVCAKLQGAKGAWPAIWMLPDPKRPDASWPHGGEIDIMERLSHDSIAYQTVHSYYTYELGYESNPPHGSTGAINPDDYNVYAVEIYPDSLSFYINDNHTFTYPRIETDLPEQFQFDGDFYLLIDMQLGGNWVGEVDPAQLPVEMLIDWVRFYKRKE